MNIRVFNIIIDLKYEYLDENVNDMYTIDLVNTFTSYIFVLACKSSLEVRFLNIRGDFTADITTTNRIIIQPTIDWIPTNLSPKSIAPSKAVVTGSKE